MRFNPFHIMLLSNRYCGIFPHIEVFLSGKGYRLGAALLSLMKDELLAAHAVPGNRHRELLPNVLRIIAAVPRLPIFLQCKSTGWVFPKCDGNGNMTADDRFQSVVRDPIFLIEFPTQVSAAPFRDSMTTSPRVNFRFSTPSFFTSISAYRLLPLFTVHRIEINRCSALLIGIKILCSGWMDEILNALKPCIVCLLTCQFPSGPTAIGRAGHRHIRINIGIAVHNQSWTFCVWSVGSFCHRIRREAYRRHRAVNDSRNNDPKRRFL